MLSKWSGEICIYNINEMKYYKTNKIAIDTKTPIYNLIYGFDYDDLASNEVNILVTENFLQELLSKKISLGFKNGELYVLYNDEEILIYEYMKNMDP